MVSLVAEASLTLSLLVTGGNLSDGWEPLEFAQSSASDTARNIESSHSCQKKPCCSHQKRGVGHPGRRALLNQHAVWVARHSSVGHA